MGKFRGDASPPLPSPFSGVAVESVVVVVVVVV